MRRKTYAYLFSHTFLSDSEDDRNATLTSSRFADDSSSQQPVTRSDAFWLGSGGTRTPSSIHSESSQGDTVSSDPTGERCAYESPRTPELKKEKEVADRWASLSAQHSPELDRAIEIIGAVHTGLREDVSAINQQLLCDETLQSSSSFMESEQSNDQKNPTRSKYLGISSHPQVSQNNFLPVRVQTGLLGGSMARQKPSTFCTSDDEFCDSWVPTVEYSASERHSIPLRIASELLDVNNSRGAETVQRNYVKTDTLNCPSESQSGGRDRVPVTTNDSSRVQNKFSTRQSNECPDFESRLSNDNDQCDKLSSDVNSIIARYKSLRTQVGGPEIAPWGNRDCLQVSSSVVPQLSVVPSNPVRSISFELSSSSPEQSSSTVDRTVNDALCYDSSSLRRPDRLFDRISLSVRPKSPDRGLDEENFDDIRMMLLNISGGDSSYTRSPPPSRFKGEVFWEIIFYYCCIISTSCVEMMHRTVST